MLGNWIIQTSTTTGTGSLTLSAITGFPALSSQFAVGEIIAYAILDETTGAPIERGMGSLDGSGLLVRSKVMATMAGSYTGVAPTAVSLSAGTKRVICTPGATSVIAAAPGIWGVTKGYGDSGLAAGAGTLVSVANRAYALPFRAGVDSDIDALVFTTTVGSASNAKVAIFSMGADGLPGVKLAESAAVDTSVIGTRVGSFTRFRPPPVFFGCILCDGVITFRTYSAGVVLTNAMGFDGAMLPYAYIHHEGATSLTFPSVWTPVGNPANVARPVLVARCVS